MCLLCIHYATFKGIDDRKAYNVAVESFSLEAKRSNLRIPSNSSRQCADSYHSTHLYPDDGNMSRASSVFVPESCTCNAYVSHSSSKHSNIVIKRDVSTSPTPPAATHIAYVAKNNSSKEAGR